ncbi:MAG: ATP-binding protein [Planctomycetaceae bacterium]
MPHISAAIRDPAVLWNAIQSVASDYIVVVDREFTIRHVNRTGGGVSEDTVLGQSVIDFTVGDSSEQLRNAIDSVFHDGRPQSLKTMVRTPDGDVREYAVRIGPLLHAGEIVAVVLCCEDVTALSRTERDLERERSVLRRLIDIQERERQLVSYEIHDGLAQYIAGAIMHFEAQQHTMADRVPREFEQGMRLLRAAADESRRLIAGLRPPALDELGIVEAIESLVADARIEIPRVDFVHELPEERLPDALETVIFRIVQEALTNARRHSRAKSAEVRVERVPGGIHVRVRDDGRGFNPAAVQDRHFGLEGIRQRCRLFGASPTIASAPRKGKTIDVTLPLPAADAI